jgi:hypothetical protein
MPQLQRRTVNYRPLASPRRPAAAAMLGALMILGWAAHDGTMAPSLSAGADEVADLSGSRAVWLQVKTDDEDDENTLFSLYSPRVERTYVLDPASSPLQYNHDASIALFQSVWVAVWNANTNPREGQPGQYNMMSTSTDLKTWSAPAKAFSDVASAENPVPCNATTCMQWQPNLFKLQDGRLGCVWSGSNGRNGRVDGQAMATYFSVLSSPTSRWFNRAIVFAGGSSGSSTKPTFQNATWTLFASQNPTVLRDGKILAPVVMTSNQKARDGPPGCALAVIPHNVSQMCFARRSSVLIADSQGQRWHASEGTLIPGHSWAQWEPTVWSPAGDSKHVLMISRFNDFRLPVHGGPKADVRMQHARSSDSGRSWTSLQPLPLDTVVSRMQVAAQSVGGDVARWLMTMNDVNPFGIRGCAGRLNVALYLAPAAGSPEMASLGFVPGVGLSEDHEIAMYPQMWQDGDRLAVIYSSGNVPRGIRVASVTLPPSGTKVVAVRNNTYFAEAGPARPETRGPWLRFYGQQLLQTASPLELHPPSPSQPRTLSAGGWIRLPLSTGRCGTLLDTRGHPTGGIVLGIHSVATNWTAARGLYAYSPYAWLGIHASKGSSTNVELPAKSRLTEACTAAVRSQQNGAGIGGSLYVGWSINASGSATFFCGSNGSMHAETVACNAMPADWPFSATASNSTVGYKNLPTQLHSSVPGFVGELGSFAVFPGKHFTAREHGALANALGVSLGVATMESACSWAPKQTAAAAIWINGSDLLSLQHSCPLPVPSSPSQRPRASRAPENGHSLLRICQSTSAGVELPPVSCEPSGPGLRATLRFRLQHRSAAAHSDGSFTVATVGDGIAHARLVASHILSVSPGSPGHDGSMRSSSSSVELRLMCSNSTTVAVVAPVVRLDEWTTVDVKTSAGVVSVNGSTMHCGCGSGGPIWLFLGEGFLHRQYSYSQDCVEHDITTLRARRYHSGRNPE